MSESMEPITTQLRRQSEREENAPSPGAVGEAEARQANDEAAEVGLSPGVNIAPGSDDDGWEVPPPVTLQDGTRIQLYKDGEGLAAAHEAIKRARKRVFIEVYIWPSDETGTAFAEALARKAREGVAVYAIYDSFGCLLARDDPFETMRKAGVRLIEFHPVWPWKSRYSWRPGNRDHRKLLVVDDRIAGVGGLNLGNRYAGTWVARLRRIDLHKLWRDAAVGIIGPGARSFSECFIRTWRYCLHRGPISRTLWFDGLEIPPAAKGRRLGKARQRPYEAGATPEPRGRPEDIFEPGRHIACMANAPTLSSPLRPLLYKLIRDARRSIVMTMAYFAPDDELIDLLCAAGKRGVRVRLMFATKSDAHMLVLAARSFYAKLLSSCCEVYEREGAMLHQKSIAVDSCVSVLGSTNLDYRSIEFNLEISAVIRSREFAGQLEAMFDHDVQFSRRIDPAKWHGRPYWDRCVQWAVNRMRYVL